jgi:hypothetical protein
VTRKRLVVLGMMGQCPFGGQTWLYLNWLRGLHRLGHDVTYVEDDSSWPYDPRANAIVEDPSYAVSHIGKVMARIGLGDKWAYRPLYRSAEEIHGPGMSAAKLRELYASCDALLNICGATVLNDDHMKAPFRVYVETDPVTNQLELANGKDKTRAVLDAHHAIVTYGENYGRPDCGVPLDGRPYLKTRQPIDLDLWPAAARNGATAYTTIGNWKQSGHDVTWNGSTYHWSKHHEFLKFIELPRLRPAIDFDLWLNVDDAADQGTLRAHGWKWKSPLQASLDPFGYQELFRGARAEWTVAKDQNVRLRSGWFSERDVCFLASGKPVIAQSTGFENDLPTGEGLFAFKSMDEVLAAIDVVEGDYPGASKKARAVAEECFEATRVCRRFLEDLAL